MPRVLYCSAKRRASDVAWRVGYESPAHFARDFKRRFGALPSRYARRLRRGLRGAIRQWLRRLRRQSVGGP